VEADDDPAPEWSFVGQRWHVVALWQNGERELRELVAAALAHAGDLAAAG
jgi:hypothetical protein